MQTQQEPEYFPDRRVAEQAIENGDELANDLLMELQESMPQGVPNSTSYGRRASDTVDTDLASLDALLGESVQARELEEQYKKDREARRKGYSGLSKEEVDFCNSRMHAFEMAREWDADYAIAVFAQYTCTHCDSARTVFSRLMEHHQHRRVATTTRWVTVSETKLELNPVLEDRQVPVCMDCLGEFGIEEVGPETPWFEEVVL